MDCAHPLDDGTAGVLTRSVDDTAQLLGVDGARYRRLLGPSVARWDDLADDVMGPLLGVPAHPLLLARFGLPTLLPATVLARLFRTEQARALWGGVAAHSFRPLSHPLSSAIGLGILTAGHAAGWAVAEGGSRSIARVLEKVLLGHGGEVHTGRHRRPPAARRRPRRNLHWSNA